MKPRILIVDADEAITQQLFWTLSDEYEVVTANDLQTAVRRATTYQPVVSILDLHLPPILDSREIGLRLVEYIKAHVTDAKVIVISAAEGSEIQENCVSVGADEFLYKPFETEQLRAAMRRVAPQQNLDVA